MGYQSYDPGGGAPRGQPNWDAGAKAFSDQTRQELRRYQVQMRAGTRTRVGMSFGATQLLAVAVNVVVGLTLASWADFSPWLGPLAVYVLVWPALIAHFGLGMLESDTP